MKLAFLCNNMKSTNGVERVLSQRLSILAESCLYEVYLITYNQYGAPFSFPISDKIHYIDLATRYINHCAYHGLYQYWDRFYSKLKYRSAINKCLVDIMPDVITCIDTHVADLITILKMDISAVKVVECHCGLSAYFSDIEKIINPYKRYRERSIKKRLIRTVRKFDKIVVMTEEEKCEWNLEGKVVSISNMLASNSVKSSINRESNQRVISVGRYAYQKGYDMLLYAWKTVQDKYPDWTLHIYGSRDGDMGDYDQLEKIKEKNQLNGVFLHPATNDVYSKYNESDFYVMSSRFESFGLVLIEAMSCGLPVISFDCKYGPRSIVKSGQTGVLVPENDVEKIAGAIISMIENEEMCHMMGVNARLESKRYLPENIMPLWHEFYRSLGKDHSIDA